ncbi:MAG: hypothetical protein LBB26_01365 [Puniceicoccales bacterium]|jgi:hypothetical protein|nr:hypothetical protein [Puniceicoccales bacterium]
MKKVTAKPLTDIFNGNWGLPTFQHTRLTPSSELEPSFLQEFPALSEQASPLPATEAVLKIPQELN